MPGTVGRTGNLAYFAVVELFRGDKDWRMFFRRCCEDSPKRLLSQAKQVRDELADWGDLFKTEEIEDVLLTLVREKLTESVAAQWDTEHAHRLCRDSLARLSEHYAGLSEAERNRLDLSGQESHETAMLTVGEENDPAAFRAALKEWERVGRDALWAARNEEGVA